MSDWTNEREAVRRRLLDLPSAARDVVMTILDRAHRRADRVELAAYTAQQRDALMAEWREKCERQARQIAALEAEVALLRSRLLTGK